MNASRPSPVHALYKQEMVPILASSIPSGDQDAEPDVDRDLECDAVGISSAALTALRAEGVELFHLGSISAAMEKFAMCLHKARRMTEVQELDEESEKNQGAGEDEDVDEGAEDEDNEVDPFAFRVHVDECLVWQARLVIMSGAPDASIEMLAPVIAGTSGKGLQARARLEEAFALVALSSFKQAREQLALALQVLETLDEECEALARALALHATILAEYVFLAAALGEVERADALVRAHSVDAHVRVRVLLARAAVLIKLERGEEANRALDEVERLLVGTLDDNPVRAELWLLRSHVEPPQGGLQRCEDAAALVLRVFGDRLHPLRLRVKHRAACITNSTGNSVRSDLARLLNDILSKESGVMYDCSTAEVRERRHLAVATAMLQTSAKEWLDQTIRRVCASHLLQAALNINPKDNPASVLVRRDYARGFLRPCRPADVADAPDLLNPAIDTLASVPAGDAVSVHTVQCLAELARLTGAVEHIDAVKSLLPSVPELPASMRARVCEALGSVLVKKEDKRAVGAEWLSQASKLYVSLDTIDGLIASARCEELCASALAHEQRWAEADTCFEHAHTLWRRVYGVDDVDTVRALLARIRAAADADPETARTLLATFKPVYCDVLWAYEKLENLESELFPPPPSLFSRVVSTFSLW